MISKFQRRANGQRGFTLIEVMAALVVFSLMTLGIVPLLLSSMKGSELSQSYAIGKNLAVEAMERVRGLPYYVKFDTQKDGRPIDLLDLYYPSRRFGGNLCHDMRRNHSSCTSLPEARSGRLFGRLQRHVRQAWGDS